MVMVPHEAHQLSILIATPVPLHIALRERKRDKPVLELSKHSKRTEIHDQQDNYLKYDPNVPQNLQIIEVDSHIIDIKEGRYRWEGEVVAAGTLLRWKQTDADVAITSTARLQTDLMIMVRFLNILRTLFDCCSPESFKWRWHLHSKTVVSSFYKRRLF